MEKNLINSRILCFTPSIEKEVKTNNRTVYHYTSPESLLAILSKPSIRFTDCQFLNDQSEYNHIRIPLKTALEKVESEIHNKEITATLSDYAEGNYDFFDYIIDSSFGLWSLRKVVMRHYVFCASTDSDLLNMWNYYLKNDKYQGYNIGISVNEFLNTFSSITNTRVKFIYGPIIYKMNDKIDELINLIKSTDMELESLSHMYDPVDRLNASQDILLSLISYIDNFRLFFKDSTFSGEKEYRFVLRVPEKQKDLFSSELKIGYTAKQGIITPYCDVPFRKIGIINNITVAPMMEDCLAKTGLQRYLQDNGYDADLPIESSRIPIRY